jgi:hypothetical protein
MLVMVAAASRNIAVSVRAEAEVAHKLGVGQAAISRLEGREDMLLSTLYGSCHKRAIRQGLQRSATVTLGHFPVGELAFRFRSSAMAAAGRCAVTAAGCISE